MNHTDIYLSFVSIFHLSVSLKQGINSILLTTRSLLCMWNQYYEKPLYHNYLYCLGMMVLKDLLAIFAETKFEDPWSEDVMQFFMLGNEYTCYFPIFTIQLSPLIPTDLYIDLFNVNALTIVTTDYIFAPICYCSCWYIDYMHRTKKENKYFCWIIVFFGHSLIQQAITNLRNVPEDFKWYPWYYMAAYFAYNFKKNKVLTTGLRS
jgi:hypothetical protein